MCPAGDSPRGEPPEEDRSSLKLPAEVRAALKRMREQQEMVTRLFESSAIKAIAERAQEQQKLATQLLASPAMRVLAEHAAQQQKQVTQLFESPAMKAISELAASQQKLAKQFFDSAVWKTAIEASRRWDEGERRILGLLAPRGWVISPSSTLADLSALIAIADAEGVEGVEAKLMAELTPDRCREIIETLCARASFAQWSGPLREAVIAHEQGRYALAVPVWLIALDGIFLIELRSDVFKQARKKNGGDLGRLSPGSRERLLDALITAIQFVAEQIPAGSEPAPGELRRHAIMHGRDPAYGTERASVQGVLLLEMLHFQLQMGDEAERRDSGGKEGSPRR
jgi:hypothetical protein